MSSEITIDAVRLALGMHQMQARVTSINIANASKADARAVRVDFASVHAALNDVVSSSASASASNGTAARLQHAADELRRMSPTSTADVINTDEQIGEMVAAGVSYQTLGEALSRQFGLMRLAISGRS